MSPTPLTDAQKRTDATLDQYMSRWNRYSDAQKTSPEGAELKDRIVDLVRQRNGDAAAADISDTLARSNLPFNSEVMRDDLDERFSRSDGADTSAPASPGPEPALSTHSSPVYFAAPGDGRQWLPGNAELPLLSDADTAAVNTRDAEIEALNQRHFRVDPALAWHPDGATLPATGYNISTLGSTHDMARDLVGKWHAAVEKLRDAFTAGSVEQLIAKQHDRIRPAINTLTEAAESSKNLHGLIARGGVAANEAFHQLRGSELDVRQSMSDTVKSMDDVAAQLGLGPRAASQSSAVTANAFADLPAVTTPDRIDSAARVGTQINDLAAKVATPAKVSRERVNARTLADSGDEKAGTIDSPPPPGLTPASALPGPAAGAVTPGTGAKPPLASDDLTKLLSSLGNGAAPLAQQAAGIPQQAAQQAAAPLTNAARQASKVPEDLLKSLRTPNNPVTENPVTPAVKAADVDRDAATAAYTPPGAASPASVGRPGTDARPHQLDANGNPADKDGNGKVDEDAVPLSKKTVKPFDLSVPADGQNMQVAGVPDPRVGEMMLNMADARGGTPLSVLDAARASGMDIPSLGDPLPASEARVGDAVIGAMQSGMYLGEGMVLTSTGLLESLSDVLGDDGFISRIPLPELPDDVPGGPDDPEVPASPDAEMRAPDTVAVSATSAAAPSEVPAPIAVEPPDAPPPAPPPPAPPATEPPPPAPVDSVPEPSDGPAPLSAPLAEDANTSGLPRAVPYEGFALG